MAAVRAKESVLFSYIEALQRDAPYERVLDAGTGPRSIRWLTRLKAESVTAVTGDALMKRQIERMDCMRPQDRLLVGNWANPHLLAGEQFETVLADYLLGAIEGFAPYFQTNLFLRLRPLTAKRLYVTGVEPYVIKRPEDEAGALIWEIGRYHDACLLLSGQQCYREYPLRWVLNQLRRSGFQPISARKFPTGYEAKFLTGKIDACRPRLKQLADKALGQALVAHGEQLQKRALAHIERHGKLIHGFAYVVAADPA